MKTGTREWATKNLNIFTGCSHNCRYCYARYNWCKRWKKMPVDKWGEMTLNKKDFWKSPYLLKGGRFMFPTRHDMLPEHIEETLDFLGRWLAVGNEILITSKPHFEVIRAICSELNEYKDKIVFRFTIGSLDGDILKFWEPYAPSYSERMQSLKYAHDLGFETSVSCEPYFDKTIKLLVDTFMPYVTDTVWIGKMNAINSRVDTERWSEEDFKKLEIVKEIQTDDAIQSLYDFYKINPKVKWKDSIKKVIGLPEEDIG